MAKKKSKKKKQKIKEKAQKKQKENQKRKNKEKIKKQARKEKANTNRIKKQVKKEENIEKKRILKKRSIKSVKKKSSNIELKKGAAKKALGKLVKKQLERKILRKQETKQKDKEKTTKKKGKGILDSYKIEADKAIAYIKILDTEKGRVYNLYLPEIGEGTQALLDEVRKELIGVTRFQIAEITEQKSFLQVKTLFMANASKILREKVSDIKKETEEFIIGMLMQDMLGLGKIEFLINDPILEEIVVLSSKEPIRVYHKKYGWLTTNIIIEKEEDINNYSNIIARRVGRQITVLDPLLDAHIITGDRANAVLYPISTKGHTITIRKFAREPWTIIELIKNNTVNIEIAALLWLAIEYEMNILVSGGTASGKTVFLNSCMSFIPPNHRVISMEDTRELMLPDFLYWCPLVTRTPNPEGKGEVSMLDLLINSLRMRPDRIILGEIRRQREAEVLFEAMHTGHSVYATVHADTAAETISRLTNPPVNVPPNMLKAVNLNVVMFRDRRKGIRRVSQIAEFVTGKETISSNILYRWIPEKDKIVSHSSSLLFFEGLSRHTGMSQTDINNNLKKKKEILSWMIKNNVNRLNNIGRVINLYYTNPDLLDNFMKKNELNKIL